MKTVKNDRLKAKESVPYPNKLDTKYKIPLARGTFWKSQYGIRFPRI